jgi:hypothetical protein
VPSSRTPDWIVVVSYTLDLYFEPAVRRLRLVAYFATRANFSIKNDDVLYENPNTGVYFSLKLRCSRNVLFQRSVVSVEFEMNYFRPSFFGIEAEREISAIVASFKPRIQDPQMHGMGEGPYTREGFLSGWNFGNAFAASGKSIKERHGWKIATMPADQLRAIWEWNYHQAERADRSPSLFVPVIRFMLAEDRCSRAVIWGQGMPALLPKVDYVFVGRIVAGERRFGLASWSEVQDVAQRAGLDSSTDPLKLAYLVTPPVIADWVANIPLIDVDGLEELSAFQVLDTELLADAQQKVEDSQQGPDPV